jgi:hypothetical protein
MGDSERLVTSCKLQYYTYSFEFQRSAERESRSAWCQSADTLLEIGIEK